MIDFYPMDRTSIPDIVARIGSRGESKILPNVPLKRSWEP